jgi:nitric oxide reductase NorQ protein
MPRDGETSKPRWRVRDGADVVSRQDNRGGSRSPEEPESFRRLQIEEFRITEEPFYLPIADEVELFEAAYDEQIPVLLKGPTGCGKTRFVEYMSWEMHRHLGNREEEGVPLITVACHEDLTSSDLVGRYLLESDETRWIDGPITRAVKFGAICYLDEVVEARKDTTVLIHPLADYRRLLPVEKRGELLEAADGFLLVLSYNPGYQSALKDLKQSTRQRFIAIEFDYPERDKEAEIIARESGCGSDVAEGLAKLGEKVRNLREHGLEEGVSTRLLVYAGKLIARDIPPRRACESAVVRALTDDTEIQRTIEEVVSAIFVE